MTVPIECPV